MKDLLLTWRLRRTAKAVFGWRTLRPAQLRAMRALMRRRDALVILPTGAAASPPSTRCPPRCSTGRRW